MKTTGLLIIALGIFTFLNAAAENTNEVLRLSFQTSNKINLIYSAATQNKLTVTIYNSENQTVFTENVVNNYGIARVYDIAALPEGDYTFVITDGKTKSFKAISYKKELVNQPKDLKVDIVQGSAEGKFNLICKGVNNKPVKVVIYSKSNGIIYEDYIESKVNFSRVYDLSKLNEQGYVFEVTSEERAVSKEVSLARKGA